MPIHLELRQFSEPVLEFGGPGEFTDIRDGLREGGPFDLRFGAGRNDSVTIGLVGPKMMVDKTITWLSRCQGVIPAGHETAQYPPFPGFDSLFRTKMILDPRWMEVFDEDSQELDIALNITNAKERFEAVLDLYSGGIRRLSSLETRKPDVVVCCLPAEVLVRCWSLNETLTKEEKAMIVELQKRQNSPQLSGSTPKSVIVFEAL